MLDLQDLRTKYTKTIMEKRIKNSDTYGGECGLGETVVGVIFLRTLKLWSCETGELLFEKTFGETLNDLTICGGLVFTGGFEGVVSVFSVGEGLGAAVEGEGHSEGGVKEVGRLEVEGSVSCLSVLGGRVAVGGPGCLGVHQRMEEEWETVVSIQGTYCTSVRLACSGEVVISVGNDESPGLKVVFYLSVLLSVLGLNKNANFYSNSDFSYFFVLRGGHKKR